MSMERRIDAKTRHVIYAGVEMDRVEGALKAWVFLTRHGISPNTICRVLGLNVSGHADC